MHIVHPGRHAAWSHPAPSSQGRRSARRVPGCSSTRAAGSRESSVPSITEHDLSILRETASLSISSAGLTQPHPNSACILVGPDGRRLASAYQRAAGAVSSEVQALRTVREGARGGVAYLNLESGDCHGDGAAVRALVDAGISRVVVGLEHPLPHARGVAVRALRSTGIDVDVLSSSTPCAAEPINVDDTILHMLEANEALLHRAVLRRPLSILKYAMTLDGKIATASGHSAWVTSPDARANVFKTRANSDVVIVGGNTVRRDNPRLTTRQEGGHAPVRVVMSRTLELPENASLWDITTAPTIVMTQRGARKTFQAMLRAKGVEVVEFDFLTPEAVADYCYDRGFLQCLWECGGVLAAPVISASVAHKLMAFVAPKIIGGARAPSPVGDLGFVEMTQALEVAEAEWQQVGRDLMLTGYLPSSGGLRALERALGTATSTGPIASTASGAPAAAAGHGVAAATVSRAAAGAAASGPRSADSSSSSSRRSSSGISSSSTEVSRAVAEANATNAAVDAALSSSSSSSGSGSNAGARREQQQQQQEQQPERSRPGDPDSNASSSGKSGRDSNSSTLVGRGTKLPSQPSRSSINSSSIAEADGLQSSGVGGASSRGLSAVGAQEAPNPSVPAAICSRRGLPPGAAVLAASQVVWFYKAWDEWGALSNFSPHPIHLPLYCSPDETPPTSIAATDRQPRVWACAEHFYQAQKFSGSSDPEARAVVDAIAAAASPEEAARTGRLTERHRPHLLTPNWSTIKVNVMLEALRAKFGAHEGPRSMLLASGTAVLVEAAPHDFVWGGGHNGSGTNMLGRLLMRVRGELQAMHDGAGS